MRTISMPYEVYKKDLEEAKIVGGFNTRKVIMEAVWQRDQVCDHDKARYILVDAFGSEGELIADSMGIKQYSDKMNLFDKTGRRKL